MPCVFKIGKQRVLFVVKVRKFLSIAFYKVILLGVLRPRCSRWLAVSTQTSRCSFECGPSRECPFARGQGAEVTDGQGDSAGVGACRPTVNQRSNHCPGAVESVSGQ